MTYPRAILRFALLTALLGGVTQARAGEPASAEGTEAKAATDTKGKEAKAAAGAEGKEAEAAPGAEAKETEAATDAEAKEAEAPAPAAPEPKVAKEPAREPTADERKQAKERATRGLYLFENGANEGALTELEAAYDLAPNRLLLYHIASVYAAMGKPVEALEDLDDLLADQGPLKPEYLEKAKALKEEQQQQVGQLDVKVNVPAVIDIDGTRAGQAPLQKPIQVKAGQHMVTVVAEGHLPQRQGVVVAGSGQAEAVFELQPMEGKLAYVQIYSLIPAVEVIVDDVSLGKTPMKEPVALAPGKHEIELQRPGYMNQRRELELSDGAHATVAFEAEEDRTAADERGRLVVVGGEGDVKVTIDRRARGKYRKPISLPAGPHIVRLEREDFEPMEREVDIPRGGEIEVKAALRSKGVKEAEIAAEARGYRIGAIASLVTGALMVGGGTGLAVWQNSKLPGAEDNLAKTLKSTEAQGCNDPKVEDIRRKACDQQIASAQGDVDNYKKWRLVGIGVAVTGAALVGLGIVLYSMAPKVPETGVEEESVASTLVPVVSAGPDGAGLLLRGRF